MNYTSSIINEGEYRKKVFAHYESILNCRLMRIDPTTATDSMIIEFVSESNHNLSHYNSRISWLEIGKIGSGEYNGIVYKYINLLNSNIEHFTRINFSQFRYPMSLYDSTQCYDPELAFFICQIDEKTIDPDIFFAKNQGKKLLYLDSCQAITKFGSIKECFSFAFKNTDVTHIRKYIAKLQIKILERALSHPTSEIPYTSITIGKNQQIMHYAISDIVLKFALDIFNNCFRDRFFERLNKLKQNQSDLAPAC